MARLTLLSPLRLEARALGGAEVVGMGAANARRRGAALAERLGADDAVGVAGVAGALVERLRPGDLLVASRLHSAEGDVDVALPSAPLVAGELRRRGARVEVGTLRSSPRFVRSRGRTGDVAAVDMESAWLVAPLVAPAAVVRAISDTPSVSPLRGGLAALRSLGVVRGALERWADACRPRELLLCEPRSFCAGVERAIEIVERALERFGAPVYVRRQIVHNLHVVGDLERKGAVFVEELAEVPDGAVVVFAAHGVAPAVRSDAERRRHTVIDATCPLVAKVHAEARRFAAQDYEVVLVGHHDHEEVHGTLGEAPERIHVVADAADVERLSLPRGRRLAYLTQTTLAVEETERVVDALRSRFGDVTGPPAADICYATQNRQDAVRAIARRCDLLVVIGSENSSNTQRLVELARREGARAELVEDVRGIELSWLAGAGVVGLTAGASAPEALVADVVAALSHLGPTTIRTERVADETVRFALPGKVR